MSDHAVIPASKWARPAHAPYGPCVPAAGVFVHHTVGRSPWFKWSERREMRNLDAVARQRGFNGISYSFVIFRSGRIYEGRGLNAEQAATLGYNSTSYSLSWAGNMSVQAPSEKSLAAARWLRRVYLNLGDKPKRGHRDVYATECPGNNLYGRLGAI